MMITFWKDKDQGQIDPDLFSEKANVLAKKIYEEGSGKINKPTQIRKFYDEVLNFKNILKTNPQDFNNLLPYIKMLNAKVSYAIARDLVSEGFKDFITDSINQIKDPNDFEVFTSFFEAFMGFYKFYDEKGKRHGGRR